MLLKNYSKSVISALIFLCCVHLSVQQCSLAIKTHIAAPSPLIIDPVSRNFQRTSDTLGNINFVANQQLLLACTGSGNYLTVRGTGATERVATCVSGQTFSVDGVNYNFNQFVCQRWPDSEQRRSGNCLGSKTNVVIGFQTINYWIPLFTCCHDEVTYHTHYTEFNLYKDAATNQAGAGRVDWSQGPFFK